MSGYGECWTEHPYYEEISTLTRLSHDGHLNKKGREAYDKKIQEMEQQLQLMVYVQVSFNSLQIIQVIVILQEHLLDYMIQVDLMYMKMHLKFLL